MRKPQPLPRSLVGVAFRPDDARANGVDASRLRKRDLYHPFHSVHVSVAPQSVRELCTVYRDLLPEGAFFSHQTAAALLGIPMPMPLDGEPLHISVAYPRHAPGGRGVVGHSLGSVSGKIVDGFPVCAPAQVWCQLAGVIGRDDLVAAGDHLVGARNREPLASHFELAETSVALPRTKGAQSRDWALPRIRVGSDSRPESLLRLLLDELGYRGLEVNAPVAVKRGTVVLHPDLSLPRRRVAFEYEGDGHRVDPRQWHVDIERRELLEAEGWRVVRVTARDLFHDRGAFLDRLNAFAPNVAIDDVRRNIWRESRG